MRKDRGVQRQRLRDRQRRFWRVLAFGWLSGRGNWHELDIGRLGLAVAAAIAPATSPARCWALGRLRCWRCCWFCLGGSRFGRYRSLGDGDWLWRALLF